MTTRAQALRKRPSQSEIRMWRVLHPFRTGGYHFRKQVAVGPYVADFVCHHAMLVIEVDGEQHGRTLSNDELRDEYMQARGYKVLRIPSTALIDNQEGVYKLIAAVLMNVPPRPRVTPSLAPLGPNGPSSATLPARGRVGSGKTAGILKPTQQARRGVRAGTNAPQPDEGTDLPQSDGGGRVPQPTSPLAGEVAKLGAQRPSAARRGVPHARNAVASTPTGNSDA